MMHTAWILLCLGFSCALHEFSFYYYYYYYYLVNNGLSVTAKFRIAYQ